MKIQDERLRAFSSGGKWWRRVRRRRDYIREGDVFAWSELTTMVAGIAAQVDESVRGSARQCIDMAHSVLLFTLASYTRD